MNGRAITIADKDANFSSSLAKYFRTAGYQVKTVTTAGEVLESAIEKERSVLILGSSVSEGARMVNLIQLLKVFNSQLRIIMVTERMGLAETRQVREAGIFYQALKPAKIGDTDELRQAVTCAFEDWVDNAVAPLPEPAQAEPAVTPAFSWRQLAGALSWVVGLVALAWAGVTALQARPAHSGSSLTTWIFFGFVALVITNQLLPIFRVKLALEIKQRKAAHSHRSGKQ